jgi:fermentation-respiration switch protein FrsA (DUF1100 family)
MGRVQVSQDGTVTPSNLCLTPHSHFYAPTLHSQGVPSEESCYASIDTVFSYLLEEMGLSPHQIVLYGRSLGSGPSCYLAEKASAAGNEVAGLILHSPFTSVYRVVIDFGFTMVGDQFPNVDRVKNIRYVSRSSTGPCSLITISYVLMLMVFSRRCPVFIVHGKEDPVVPFKHGKYLYEGGRNGTQSLLSSRGMRTHEAY